MIFRKDFLMIDYEGGTKTSTLLLSLFGLPEWCVHGRVSAFSFFLAKTIPLLVLQRRNFLRT